ncbi:hypothetical protein TPHA_0M00500 [Tetrapisispora phaffii CBS 4417]|uniref:UPF3 domain-containing protein n=1 Tax=Tetrapisispora phaffii (strain ATCC 24235 / CBS 4417 / NBRC 1672 / NRRL Y-8282 / UCD 70-5) TaxID=1071381 RepID=G8C0B0_TETPH|nr:hypothetical protein TPHA_0M00500 [Tetrapisispora phaffii CBS 4417]CCE65625.1 hypothetical protein TPHA_0M00500 [Tetrapisispora phaffii CBS 4417]
MAETTAKMELPTGEAAGKNQGDWNAKGKHKKGRRPENNASNATQGKSRSQRSRHRRKAKDKEVSGFKLVLQSLPPALTETEFWDAVKSVVNDTNEYQINLNSFYFVQGKLSDKPFHDPVYSRSYIMFKDMENLRKFALKIQDVTFTDANNDSSVASIKISPYNRSYNSALEKKKPAANKKVLEGTIKDDPLFKAFVQSMKIMAESDQYMYSEINLFKPLKKELDKQKQVNEAILKQTEKALVELAGAVESEKKSKKKKKKKKKSEKKKEEETASKDSSSVAKTKSKPKGKPKLKSKSKLESKSKTNAKSKKVKEHDSLKKEKNNNVVILEAAGKKELQRRKRTLAKKENDLKNVQKNSFTKLPSLMPNTPNPTPSSNPKMKILKRPNTE